MLKVWPTLQLWSIRIYLLLTRIFTALIISYKDFSLPPLDHHYAGITILNIGRLMKRFSRDIKSRRVYVSYLCKFWQESVQGCSVAYSIDQVTKMIMKDFAGFINSGLMIPILQSAHWGKGGTFLLPMSTNGAWKKVIIKHTLETALTLYYTCSQKMWLFKQSVRFAYTHFCFASKYVCLCSQSNTVSSILQQAHLHQVIYRRTYKRKLSSLIIISKLSHASSLLICTTNWKREIITKSEGQASS